MSRRRNELQPIWCWRIIEPDHSSNQLQRFKLNGGVELSVASGARRNGVGFGRDDF